MAKKRASATGGLLVAVMIMVVLLMGAASGGGGSTDGSISFGRSLQHTRARNLRLQSMIAALTERQTLRIAGFQARSHHAAHRHAEVVSHRPETKSSPAMGSAAPSECDPNYEGACLDPNATDYDCEGGSGNGPDYTGEVRVVGIDEFGLDADGDGIGCEAE